MRAGLAEAHIALAAQLGRRWVQDNVAALLSHWANLCAHPRCLATTDDELFVRACAGTVLRTTFGLLLSEAGQATAARDLAMLVKRGVAELGAASPTVAACRSTLVVALTELGHLIAELDGSAAAILPVCVEAATAASAHPAFGVRQAAAWVFRCLALSSGISLHSLLTTLLGNVARASADAHASAPPDVVARFKVVNAEGYARISPGRLAERCAGSRRFRLYRSPLQGAAAALAAALVCTPQRSIQVDLSVATRVLSVAMSFVTSPPPAAGAAGAGGSTAAGATADAAAAVGGDLDDDLTPAVARLEVGWGLLRAVALAAADAAVVRPHVDAILAAMKPFFVSAKKVRHPRVGTPPSLAAPAEY